MFNKSNMKCLIFPGASNAAASASSNQKGGQQGSSAESSIRQQQQHQTVFGNPSLLHAQNLHLMASGSVCQDSGGGQEEFIWEAPQLSGNAQCQYEYQMSPRHNAMSQYLHLPTSTQQQQRQLYNRGSAETEGAVSDSSGQHQMNPISRNMDYSYNNSPRAAVSGTQGENSGGAMSPALATMLMSDPSLSGHESSRMTVGHQSSGNERDSSNAEDFQPVLGAPRVPIRRPMSCSPSISNRGKYNVSSQSTRLPYNLTPQQQKQLQQHLNMSASPVTTTSAASMMSAAAALAFNQQLMLMQPHRPSGPQNARRTEVASGLSRKQMFELYQKQQQHMYQMQMQYAHHQQQLQQQNASGEQQGTNQNESPQCDLARQQQKAPPRPTTLLVGLNQEHQMESLSNFGDNCSRSSKSRGSRSTSGRNRHRTRSRGRASNSTRSRSRGGERSGNETRRSGSHHANVGLGVSSGASVVSGGRRSHSGRHHRNVTSHNGGQLSRSNRRMLGGSMSSVSAKSHKSKRRDRDRDRDHQQSRSARRSNARRDRDRDPLATFQLLSSPMSPSASSYRHPQARNRDRTEDKRGNEGVENNGGDNEGESPTSNAARDCDCACAEKLWDLEQRLEGFRVAVLEEMQYSLEYNNSRWAKFDKRFIKELRNMRDLFELRVETVRLESEQRLQAKAQQEREALQAQLHNTQSQMQSATMQLIQNSYMAAAAANLQHRPHAIGINRRLSLPDLITTPLTQDECQNVYDIASGTCNVPESNKRAMGRHGNNHYENEKNRDKDISTGRNATTPICITCSEGGTGYNTSGCVCSVFAARDSGIFEASASASHSSNASCNHHCSSCDVSSAALCHLHLQSQTQAVQQHLMNTAISENNSHSTDANVDGIGKRGSFSHHTYSTLTCEPEAEPANIRPQSRLNWNMQLANVSCDTSITGSRDSEVENEIHLRQVPVLKCLPSERLKQHSAATAKRVGSNFTAKTTNDFAGLTIDTELTSRPAFQSQQTPLSQQMSGGAESGMNDRRGFKLSPSSIIMSPGAASGGSDSKTTNENLRMTATATGAHMQIQKTERRDQRDSNSSASSHSSATNTNEGTAGNSRQSNQVQSSKREESPNISSARRSMRERKSSPSTAKNQSGYISAPQNH